MTGQATRTAYDGSEQRRAPITRPLYLTSHGSIHRHHVNHAVTSPNPLTYDGLLSPETHPDKPLVMQHVSPTVDWISTLCEEIAATLNEREALQLVSTRIGEWMNGASVDVLAYQDSAAQNTSRTGENFSSLTLQGRMRGQWPGEIEVPLMSSGARVGTLRIVPHSEDTSQAHDLNALRLIGTALAQALERHRLRAAVGQHGACAVQSDEDLERWEAFLARVAHEVKTPLTCINGHAQLVRRYVRSARNAATGALTLESAARVVDACERHLPALERQVAHIERLMRDMLDLAQIEHGPLSLALERCDFVSLLQRAIRDVDVFENCELALTIPDRVWLTCDARRIEQALYDVLHYAIRVGGYGGTVCVRVTERRLNGVKYVMAVIGNRRHAPGTHDCAILSRHELRMLSNYVVAGVDQVPAQLALGVALSATISRMHGGNLYYQPPAATGGVFVLALPVSGPRAT